PARAAGGHVNRRRRDALAARLLGWRGSDRAPERTQRERIQLEVAIDRHHLAALAQDVHVEADRAAEERLLARAQARRPRDGQANALRAGARRAGLVDAPGEHEPCEKTPHLNTGLMRPSCGS